MRRYPGIQRSPLGKEVHYFDRYWQGNPPEDIAAEYASLFPRPPGSIVGEWTPRYLADPLAIRLLGRPPPRRGSWSCSATPSPATGRRSPACSGWPTSAAIACCSRR